MIYNTKIKASPIKGIPIDQVMKKLEQGKTVTGLQANDHVVLHLEIEADITTIQKVVEYVQELGKVDLSKE